MWKRAGWAQLDDLRKKLEVGWGWAGGQGPWLTQQPWRKDPWCDEHSSVGAVVLRFVRTASWMLPVPNA